MAHKEGDREDKVVWSRMSVTSTPVNQQKAEKVFTINNFIAKSDAEVFYGIAFSEGETQDQEDIQKVFVDKAECLAALKKHRGSRFKAFRTYEDALKFAEEGTAVASSQGTIGEEGVTPQPPLNVEKPSPFRGPKSQDLVKFRKSIEKADLKYFSQCVEENPRYLVSSGDTPAILQEGFRYNALHVACRTDRPIFVDKVLSIVSKPEFFQRLYPDDSLDSATRRSAFLLDLYLNTPDKGFNETPLHFASKHGSLECVRILSSYPGCDMNRPNKYGQTALEIAGSRMKGESSVVIGEIKQAMGEQYYVPLLRDDDLCLLPQVGDPWSPQLESPSSSFSECLTSSPLGISSASPVSPSLKVRGVAGPMNASQADTFHHLWRSFTTASPTPKTSFTTPSPARRAKGLRPASLRITDHEKGLERAGRLLALEQRVGWREYWGFLDTFVNMASEEGLNALEKYLRNKTEQLRKEREELDASDLAERLKEAQIEKKKEEEEEVDSFLNSPSDTENQEGLQDLSQLSWLSQASNSSLAQLCRGLEALRLNASLSPQADFSPYACSKFLSSLEQQQEASPGCEVPEGSEDTHRVGRLAQQVSYVLKSVEVSAGRVCDVLREVAFDPQSSISAGLFMNRTLRTKLRSEVACLRAVVARVTEALRPGDLDLGFVHPFLASRAVMAVWQNSALADMAAVTQAVKVIVSHMDLVPLESSDEESSGSRHFEAPRRNTAGDSQHLACVLRCLNVALQGVANTSNGITSPEVPQLEQCHCPWESRVSDNAEPASTLERDKAATYLRKALKGDQKDPVMRHLSFTQEEEEQEEALKKLNPTLLTQGTTPRTAEITLELHSGSRSSDSFVSAASSVEGDMCTPEEGLRVFIGGAEASKTDVDVLEAVGDQVVDERRYPHVFQWQLLVTSFPEEQRGSWASPFCWRGGGGGGRGGVKSTSAPSKLSLPSTPVCPKYYRPAASTPRVLFRPL